MNLRELALNKFSLLGIFLSVCCFCNADKVGYNIISLSSAGREFDLPRNTPLVPNVKGQTIGNERQGPGNYISWHDDPDTGRQILPNAPMGRIRPAFSLIMGM
jgi:hypothetical protein